MRKHLDKTFLWIILLLSGLGFIIFTSASLGLLARSNSELFASVAWKQLIFGLGLGLTGLFVISRIKYVLWRKYAFYIFLASVVLTLMVFIPGIGLSHNGATRWINLGFISFQPSELLKYGFIIYIAAWYSNKKKDVTKMTFGLLPFVILSGVVGAILVAQPDTDTLAVMLVGGAAIYFAAGAPWKHIFLMGLIGIIGLGTVIAMNPYIKERLLTFIDPSKNGLTSSYQIQQSLIAIGSGQVTGRGFGQSVQKFSYLPEPIGDSIFAVAAEEFGFIGTFLLLLLFLFFAARGLKIASRSTDTFGKYVTIGFITMITAQACMNIAAMLAIIPLSGQTLPFVSHGGTALMITLCAMGIVLNVSKFQTRA
jgi:cell division protein FtsW